MSLICRRKQSNSTSRDWKNFLSNSLGSRSVNNLSIEQNSRINYALCIRFTNQIHFAVKGYRKMVEFTSKALPRDRGYRSKHQRHFGRSSAPFRQHRSQQPCKQRNSRVPPVRPALAHKRTWNTRQPFVLASRCEHDWAFLSYLVLSMRFPCYLYFFDRTLFRRIVLPKLLYQDQFSGSVLECPP